MKNKNSIRKFFINKNGKIKEAMHQMGKVAYKTLYISDDKDRLIGSLTDGDIRRWVLAEGKLTDSIVHVYNKRPLYVHEQYDVEKVKRTMISRRIESMPVIDNERKIKDILLWSKLFGSNHQAPKRKISLPVVIMAGGKGTRLDPYTRILPKPLMPIGEKTILEIIMDRFSKHGINKFILSINHKAHIIKAYFQEIDPGVSIQFIEEKKPLGTAGSLRLLGHMAKGPLIVTNCDILIECDYSEVVDFHKRNKNDITLVSSFRHFVLPYGICEIKVGGALISLDEKPEFDILANTGMYVLNSDMIDLIPPNKIFNMTDLINLAQSKGKNVAVFPVDEKSWVDIGQLEEYHHALKILELQR